MARPCIKCGANERNTRGDCLPCKREYYVANKDRLKAKQAKWAKSNPEKVKATHAKYLAENPGKAKEASAKYRVKNPRKVKESCAKYYIENTERVKEICAKYREKNPEKRKAYEHKRRAQKVATGGTFTADDIKAMLKSQKGKCVTCGANIKKDYHIDHIMPLVLGGNNNIHNIQLLCPHCNLSKSAKHPINFMQEMGYLL